MIMILKILDCLAHINEIFKIFENFDYYIIEDLNYLLQKGYIEKKINKKLIENDFICILLCIKYGLNKSFINVIQFVIQ